MQVARAKARTSEQLSCNHHNIKSGKPTEKRNPHALKWHTKQKVKNENHKANPSKKKINK